MAAGQHHTASQQQEIVPLASPGRQSMFLAFSSRSRSPRAPARRSPPALEADTSYPGHRRVECPVTSLTTAVVRVYRTKTCGQ